MSRLKILFVITAGALVFSVIMAFAVVSLYREFSRDPSSPDTPGQSSSIERDAVRFPEGPGIRI